MTLLQRLARRFFPISPMAPSSDISSQFSHIMRQMGARHADSSIIASADDDYAKPNSRLFDLAAEAIRVSRDLKLDIFTSRTSKETKWLIPWQDFSETWLTKADFEKSVVQKLDDVSVPEIMHKYKALFEDAELIFVDGPKDGSLNQSSFLS